MANSEEVVSSSLIRVSPRVPLSSEDGRKFCLGLPGWCPCDDCSTVESVDESVKSDEKSKDIRKSKKKSLKLKRNKRSCNEVTNGESLEPYNKELKVDGNQRFIFDLTSDDLNTLKGGNCPANMVKNNMWALKTFEEWRVARNSRFPVDPCPENIHISDNKEVLCDWLCKFTSETCKANGEEYTPRSIYLMLGGLQRHSTPS